MYVLTIDDDSYGYPKKKNNKKTAFTLLEKKNILSFNLSKKKILFFRHKKKKKTVSPKITQPPPPPPEIQMVRPLLRLNGSISGLSYNNRLPRWLIRRLPEKISTFMGKRRTNIHKLYTELAARIVNFDIVQEIDELERVLGNGVSPLPKLRQKYVKYAQQMVEVENLGVEVNKGNQLQKLLVCIQKERLFLKQSSRSLGQEFFAGGDDKEYFAGGDGLFVRDDKPTELYDNHYARVDKPVESRKAGKVFEVTNARTGEKSILDRTGSNQAKQILLPDQNNKSTQGKVSTTKYAQREDDDDEGIALYGLICA